MAPTSTVSVLVAFALLCAAAGPVRAQSGIDVEDLPANAAEPARTASGTPPAAAQSAAAPEEQAAMRAYAGGDLAKALDLYRALADRQDDPKERARLLLTAAWLSWQLQDPKTSRQTLETALYADPEVAFRQDLYTPEFHELYQDAFREAVEKRRLRASQAINEAAGSMRLGDNVRARTLLAESLALRPDDPDGVYNLALLELREHHDDAALAGFERVLALERGHPDEVTPALKTQALNNAAVIYFARGDYQDAEGALAEAVKLGIPVVGVVDTNHSPEGIGYVIPGNDDSSRAIRLYARGVADAVLEGRSQSVEEIVEASRDEFVEVDDEASEE